jgi:hypothetical protein
MRIAELRIARIAELRIARIAAIKVRIANVRIAGGSQV